MKSKTILISIVTPSFNQAKYINQTLESVGFSRVGVEHIIIDGGSKDQTVPILKRCKYKIYWISERDRGQSDALNKGLKMTRGQIVTYLNSDDYYLPGALSLVADIFAKNPEVMWVVGDALIVDEKGKQIQKFIRLYKKMWRILYFPNLLFVINPFPQPAVFFRKEVFNRIGPFSESLIYAMDYEYWLRIQRSFGRPMFVDKPLAAFRIHSQSKGTTAYRKQFYEGFSVSVAQGAGWLAVLLHRLHNQLIFLFYAVLK